MTDLISNRKIDTALNTKVVSMNKPLNYTKKVLIPKNSSLLSNNDILKTSKAIANKSSAQINELIKKSTYQKLDEIVTGGLETGATLITGSTTGLAGRAIGIATGLSKSVISGKFGTNEGAKIVEQEALKFQSAATYSPKTKKGQIYLKQTGEFLAPLEAIPIVSVEASVIGNSTRIAGNTIAFNRSGALASKDVKSGNKIAEVIAKRTDDVTGKKNKQVSRSADILGRVDGSFSAIEPGPLANNIAENFSGGKYKVVTLENDIILYRAGTANQPLGQFFSLEVPSSVLQTRVDKAVLPVWPGGAKSPIDTAFEVEVPKGTQVYIGEVGSQGGAFIGGTEQIVVLKPWTIDGIKVLSTSPLK